MRMTVIKSPRPGNRIDATLILSVLLIVSAGFNIYWFLENRKGTKEVLAVLGPEKFFIGSLDKASAGVLANAAERWADQRVLTKEASARSVPVKDLLKKEVEDKVQVSPEEVYARYARSPAADKLPWPQVLKAIENELRKERAAGLKNIFVKSLYPKYRVELRVRARKAGAQAGFAPSAFPVYRNVMPPSEISPEGKVISPPSEGPKNAPVVLEIYSDFMCPFSHRFSGVSKELRRQYPEGLRLVFHQFPLPMHPGAHRMAEASVCAQEQGKFWEIHDRLMAGDPVNRDIPALTQIAEELGMDVPKFKGCVDSGKYVSWVDADIARGKRRGATGTPAFFINGRMGTGAQKLEMMKPLIEWHLKPSGRYPAPPSSQKPSSAAGCGAPSAGGPALDPNRVYPFPADWLKTGPALEPEKPRAQLLEFLDYNCPYCRKGDQTISDYLKKHPGEIQVIVKNFPLSIHPKSFKTSEATLCAHLQGKFWEYSAEIFGESWGKQDPADLKAAAKKLGLNETEFNECLDTDQTKERVANDIRVGQSIGVRSTPTYFVDGKPLVGAQTPEALEKALEKKN